jgi:hypothetical protein
MLANRELRIGYRAGAASPPPLRLLGASTTASPQPLRLLGASTAASPRPVRVLGASTVAAPPQGLPGGSSNNGPVSATALLEALYGSRAIWPPRS